MNALPDAALAIVFVVVIGGALLVLLYLGVKGVAVWIGNWIANKFGGSARW